MNIARYFTLILFLSPPRFKYSTYTLTKGREEKFTFNSNTSTGIRVMRVEESFHARTCIGSGGALKFTSRRARKESAKTRVPLYFRSLSFARLYLVVSLGLTRKKFSPRAPRRLLSLYFLFARCSLRNERARRDRRSKRGVSSNVSCRPSTLTVKHSRVARFHGKL